MSTNTLESQDVETDGQKLGMLNTFIQHALEQHEDKLNRAGLNRDYHRGAQWTEEEEKQYKAKGVTPITINHILPIINAISGLQRQNRQDVKVRARKGGASAVAGVLTELMKHTFDLSDGQDIAALSFNHGIITSEDYLKLNLDKGVSPNGQIEFTRHSCFEVLPDPDAKEYDLNKSAKFVIHRYWQDKDEIAAIYDLDSAREIVSADKVDDLMNYFYGEELTSGDDIESLKKFRSLIYEVWWKEKEKALLWLDKELATSKLLTKEKDIRQAKKSVDYMPERFEIVNKVKTTLHKSVLNANKLLEDVINPFGEDITLFPFVRFSPYWSDGYSFGVIDNLIGPQTEENINRTQATRILNQTSNTGWIVKSVNSVYKKFLQSFGSLAGIVVEKDKCGGEAERIMPKPLSTGHVALAQQSVTDLKEISSANDALQGYNTGKVESGVALDLKRRQGAMSLQPIMDNFNWSLKILGKMVTLFIRKLKIYTPEEIRAVIDESNLIDAEAMQEAEQRFRLRPLPPYVPPQPDPQRMLMLNPLDQLKVKRAFEQSTMRSQNEIKRFPKIMRNYDQLIRREAQEILFRKMTDDIVGDYGITVTLSPEAPTIQIANMLELAEIAKNYPNQLPITTYIKNSGLTNKEQIISDIEEQQQKMAAAVQQAKVKAQTGVQAA